MININIYLISNIYNKIKLISVYIIILLMKLLTINIIYNNKLLIWNSYFINNLLNNLLIIIDNTLNRLLKLLVLLMLYNQIV